MSKHFPAHLATGTDHHPGTKSFPAPLLAGTKINNEQYFVLRGIRISVQIVYRRNNQDVSPKVLICISVNFSANSTNQLQSLNLLPASSMAEEVEEALVALAGTISGLVGIVITDRDGVQILSAVTSQAHVDPPTPQSGASRSVPIEAGFAVVSDQV